MTSSDVLDTCLAVQLARASDILLDDIDRLLAALRRRAEEHKFTLCVGRSHGIHAEPTTFGLKLAGHYAEFARNRARRSEEHTSELQSLMRISYAVFCLKKKKHNMQHYNDNQTTLKPQRSKSSTTTQA